MPTPSAPPTGIHALASQYDNALNCIRCGLCLSVCPTYQLSFAEEESPRGRIALARAVAEDALPVTPDFVRHSQNCLLCEACTAICPAGVQMEPLGVAVREVIAAQGQGARARLTRRLQRVLMDAALGDMGRFRLLCRLVRLYQRSGARALVRHTGLLRLLRLDAVEALLPEMPARFLIPEGQRWGDLTPRLHSTSARPPISPRMALAGAGETVAGAGAGSQAPNSPPRAGEGPGVRSAALFTGCIMSTAFAPTTEATGRVLARRGYEVVAVPGQGCCGALHLHSGAAEGARALARANIDAIDPAAYDAIAVNAAGCGSTLKGYGHLLTDDPVFSARATAFAARVRDVTELLDEASTRRRGGAEGTAGMIPSGLPPRLRASALDHPLPVTYQEPCHLAHAQRITQQPRRILRGLAGVDLREMNESALCCGSAGIYNLTHAETAAKLLNRKLDNAVATGAEVVVTANPGCLLQLQVGVEQRGLKLRVMHLVDLIDERDVR